MPGRRAQTNPPEPVGARAALHRAFRAAATTEDVYRVVLEEAATAVGAAATSVALLDLTGEWVEVVAMRGYAPEVQEQFTRFRADADLPLAEAIRSQRLIVHTDRQEFVDRYEGVRSSDVPAGRQASASVPVHLGDHVIGAIGLSFDHPIEADDDLLALLTAAAEGCGRAMERTMAVAAEREQLQQLMEAARGRLAFVSAATRRLARSLDLDDVLRALTQLVVPRFADWASVLLPEGDELVAATLVHRDRLQEDLDERAGRFRCAIASTSPSATVFRSGEPVLVPGIDDDVRARMDAYPDLRDLLARTRARLIVPMTVQDRIVGVLTLADGGNTSFDEDDLAVAVELASRAGTALDNAVRYAAERDMVEVLQRAVLPAELPHASGLALTARYLPASASAKVGGDWYDAFELRDGRVGLCVGDVVGHGIEAAACMGQLRNALRVYALDGTPPHEVVTQLNRFAIDTAVTDFATLLYAVYDPGTGDLSWTNAGHPSMLCRRPVEVEVLSSGHGLPVGITVDIDYTASSTTLGPGDVIVIFTDGLVERRDEAVSVGLDRLQAEIDDARGGSLDELADRLLTGVAGTQRGDDICILVLQHAPGPG